MLVEKALFSSNQDENVTPPIPLKTNRKKWERIDLPGFPYAPQEEQGVLAIFAILCSKKVIPWTILDISTNGIDCVCFDNDSKKEIRVELKYILSGIFQGIHNPFPCIFLLSHQ